MARRKGVPGNVGDPLGSGVAASMALGLGAGNRRESDRIIVPMKLGNSGGGKGPDFWYAFEDGDATVIGDEPDNTQIGRNCPRSYISRRRRNLAAVYASTLGAVVGLVLKPVGKPDA